MFSSNFVNIVISLVNKNIVANDHLLLDYHCIKGTFLADFFTQSKPAWVDDLGTRKLIYFFMLGALYFTFYRRNIILAPSPPSLRN
jgi:hypothetical protein